MSVADNNTHRSVHLSIDAEPARASIADAIAKIELAHQRQADAARLRRSMWLWAIAATNVASGVLGYLVARLFQ
jgi:hypothetical protein